MSPWVGAGAGVVGGGVLDKIHTGGCLCGQVRYRLRGELRPLIACHCNQCRRTSGHFVVATAVGTQDFELTQSSGLRWYRSSAFAQRGFCNRCGASLLWQHDDAAQISIMAGSLDSSAGLSIETHIFAESRGDYYAIEPQNAACASVPAREQLND